MKRLSLLKSKSKWLILDVSRENSTGTQSGAANAGALKKLVSPSGVLVLQSCSEGERRYGNVETERGLFTEQLLEAFDGDADANDDGRISAREVCAYVSKQTSAESQARFNAPQTPRFSDNFADFIVAENLRQSGLTRDAWARAEALYAESHELAMADKFDEAKARIADAIKIVANATDETAKKRYLDRQKEIELLASTVGDEATRSDVCVVSNAAELFDAVTNAADGAVVKLKDGTYKMTAELAPRRSLTFVGESGDREKVQLVFPGAAVTANSGVELAFENLTLTAERAVAINMLQDSAVKATQCNIVASQNPAVYGLGRCFLKDSNVRGRERITMNDLMRMNQDLTLYPIGVLVLGGGSLTAENCDIAPGVLIGPKAQASSLKKCALHRNVKSATDTNWDYIGLVSVADATCEIIDCRFYNPGQIGIILEGGRALISGGEIRGNYSSAPESVSQFGQAVAISEGSALTLRDVKIVDCALGVRALQSSTCDATNVTFEHVASKWGYDPSSRITSDGQAAPNSYGQPMNNGYGY